MKGKTAMLVVGLGAVAGLAIYLLVASGREGGPQETPGSGAGSVGTEPGSSAGTQPRRSGDPPRVVRPPPDPRRIPVAATHDAGVADSIAVPRNPAAKKETLAEKLAAHALQRQVAMLRVELASLKERGEKLTKVLARLKTEGGANALQLQQIQRQLQQSIDAQPRVQALLEKAEQEQREADKKKLEEKSAPEAK